jgi:amino acid adenylation domain-containing protein
MQTETLTQKLSDIINKFPNNVAVVKPYCTWDYQAFDRAIRVIQKQLKEYNFAPQSVIGLLISDPLWLAASIWAVIRERLIYVVLDVTYPQERLSYLLEDCQAAMLLIDAELSSLHHELTNSTSNHLIDCESSPLPEENTYLQTCQAEDLVTLYYTSGSTGKPKGVMHNHAAILHEVRVHTATLEITPGDRFSALYSLATVGSNRDFYAALLNGASWNFFPFRVSGLIGLTNWIQSQQLTIFHAIPLLFREINNTSSLGNCLDSVRVVFVAGDRVLPDDIRLFRQNFSNKARFYTGIGASEASSIYTHWFIPEEDSLDYSFLPSGYPLPEKEVFLVNDKREKVSHNEEGEIAVCSHYLSLGYFGNKELTQQVFEERENGLRIYFTGDNGRFDEQGRLVFIGRKDNQVKINGFRVELGEIEALLSQYFSIQNVAVMAKDNPFGDKRLVGYIALKEGENLVDSPSLSQELREFLKLKLPNYMIPSLFIILDNLPITPNGKIDRKRLPEPDWMAREENQLYALPTNDNEKQLSEIWETVLGIQSISIHDNFLELGGGSLQALQLLSHIEKRWQIQLPLSVIYQFPTVEQLAQFLEKPEFSNDYYSLIPLQSQGKCLPIFGIHNHTYQQLVKFLENEQPFYLLRYGLAAKTTDNNLEVTIPDDIEYLASHYCQEIQKFYPQGPYFIIGTSFGGKVAYELANKLTSVGKKVELLVIVDTYLRDVRKNYLWWEVPFRFIQQIIRRILNFIDLDFRQKRVKIYKKFTQIKNAMLNCKYPQTKVKLKNYQFKPYNPQPYGGDMIFFKALKPYYCHISLCNYLELDPSNPPEDAWKTLSKGKIDVHEISGDHASILSDPSNVKIIAEILKSRLSKISDRT